MTISKEEFAKMISGFEYPARDLIKFSRQANDNGLLIIYGMSDDLLEFDGIYSDEISAWGGVTTRIGTKGVTVKAIWAPDDMPGTSWKIIPECPHATFTIMEDGAIFCLGAVIHKDDINA